MMDDGAADIATSVAMLTEAGRQGVSTMVATPHFYPGQESMATFLQRRCASLEQLTPHLPTDAPRLLTGAEVLVREGTSQLDLRPLCIEGTDCLLVELPFMQPPYWLYEELENITYGQRLTLILAHVDRYMPWYSSKRMNGMKEFPDIIFQLNGEAFLNRHCYAALRRWLPDTLPGSKSFIGRLRREKKESPYWLRSC
jgi:protein-tyrosine phosphatase